MFNELKSFWINGLNFRGRARRREYWVAYLWNMSILYVLIGISIACLFSGINFSSGDFELGLGGILGIGLSIITSIYSLVVSVAQIAICVRRCHDVGLSGWIYLFCILGCFLCGIGGVVWLVITCLDSKEDNQWGTNPKVYNVYKDSTSIITAIVVFIGSILIYVALIFTGAFASFLSVTDLISSSSHYSNDVDEEVQDIIDNLDTDVIDDSDIEDVVDDTNISENTEEEITESNNDIKFSLLDEETGKPMFRLVTYDYDTTYENGVDKSEVIFTFIEPEGYKVNQDYLSDNIGFASTLFFLEGDAGTITLGCSLPSGVEGFYKGEVTDDSYNYEVLETEVSSKYNSDFGYDILFDKTTDIYYGICYFGVDSSFVMEFPSCEEFDSVDEVKEFLKNNF